MTPAPTKNRLALVGPVLFIGIVLAASLYAFGGLGKFLGGSKGTLSCAASAETAKKLKPLAKGEVAAVQVLEKPTPATPIQFLNGGGKGLSMADFTGKVVLLNLWATWCAPCRHEMPALDQLNADLGKDGRFEVVAVNIDTRNFEKPRAFLKEINVKSLTYYSDGTAKVFADLKSAGRAFGMPTTVLIDEKGCELAYLAGPAEWAGADAKALIRAALEK
jgi:thiol-disulfide isomerase/thioredoxin